MLMSVQPHPWPEPAPEIVAAVRAVYAQREPPLPVTVRDRLGQVFPDSEFAAAFGVRGRPGWSSGRLALVTVLQMAENLTDRQAAEAVRDKISWKYALGLGLDDGGFDASVLSPVPYPGRGARLGAAGAGSAAGRLGGAGVGDRGWASAHRLHLCDLGGAGSEPARAGRESVRACLEALSAVAPDWLAAVIDVAGWSRRYGARIDTWRLPATPAKRAELVSTYGADALLLRAVSDPQAPAWLRELPAVEVLRVVLLQNYLVTTDATGQEVLRAREADTDGLPPGRARLSSPYDTDARWAAKGDDLYWNGYKVHVTETCDRSDPRRAGPARSAARRALPRLGLPVGGAGHRQPAPLGGHAGHPVAGRSIPAGQGRRWV
jgi:hypothetical protein